MRHNITTTLEDDLFYRVDGSSPEEIIALMQTLVAKHSTAGLTMYLSTEVYEDYGCLTAKISLMGRRLETDAEMAKREKEVEDDKKRQEDYVRQQAAALGLTIL